MKQPNAKTGFSLVEVTASSVIFIMAIGMAVSGYMFSLKNVNQGDTQDELDMDVRLALERLKLDLRLSSLDEIHYYPEGPGPYQALSFPKAYDSDGDGLVERDENGIIIWDETVIYHIRPTTPHQLVKTTFSPRDITLTDAERQAQLETVVTTGFGTSAVNGQNASSHTLFENLIEWKIIPQSGRYDAYSPSSAREHLSLGYSLLAGGVHDFQFKVIGKNDSSSGYKVALDRLTLSTPNIDREAEGLTVSSQTGATAVPEYRLDGASGNYYLTFPATKNEDTFTISVDTDRWVETNFRGSDQEEVIKEDTTINFDKTLNPMDYVVALKGNDITWEAELQTGSTAVNPPLSSMQNWVVRIMLKGSELADNGNWFAYNGRKCQLTFRAANNGRLRISDVYIGESAGTTNASIDFISSTITDVTFNGGSIQSSTAEAGQALVSDWVDMPIDKDKNYVVSFRIDSNDDKCHPAKWVDVRGSYAKTCTAVTNNVNASSPSGSWNSSGYVKYPMLAVLGLESIKASYPEKGYYISQIFNTGLTAPTYNDISWNAEVPTGTTLAFKVRTGNNPDLSDASDWADITSFNSPRAVNAAFKRYVQFMAIMTSSTDGLSTPKLKDVSIDWDGPAKMINVGGIIAKGPDHGQIEITVDGNPLRSALIVDLEIYKDVYMSKGTTRRISSSMKVDVTPRNTSL